MGSWGVRRFRASQYDESALFITPFGIKMPGVRVLPLQERSADQEEGSPSVHGP